MARDERPPDPPDPPVSGTRIEDPALGEGAVIGDYRVVRVIGAGSFGTVYEGLHPLIGKRVAIKVLARKYSADGEAVSRFIAEARVVNEIRHRNIVDIFSFNQLPDGRQYFVMEFLDGPTLEAYLLERGPLSAEEAVPLLRDIASALAAAHRMGVAHRDVKPANVMVTFDGGPSAKLIDFGLAKLTTSEATAHQTRPGSPLGTPKYMSPEQSRSKAADHRSDVYAFGLITYEMLVGAPPFEGKDSLEYMLHHASSAPPPPSQRNPALPPTLDAAILSMLEKDPERRPRELLPVVELIAAVAAAAAPRTNPRARRWPWLLAGAAAVATGAALFLLQPRGSIAAPAPPLPPAPLARTLPEPAPAPPVPAPATVVTPPARITLRMQGTADALVYGPDDELLGKVPGAIQLPRGDRSVRLRFAKRGFEDLVVSLVPQEDQELPVRLEAKRPAPRRSQRAPDEPIPTDL